MNPKLLALLVAAGATAAGVIIYFPRADVTRPELVDAGIGACPAVEALCPARRPKAGGGYELAYVRVKARDCRANGGGFVMRREPAAGGDWFNLKKCRKAPTEILGADEDAVQDEPFDCACTSGANCTTVHPRTGLTMAAPPGVTMGPDYGFSTFSGAGCVRKSCDAVDQGMDDAGNVIDESWPAGCPK